jgi:hypothetical protein
VYDTALPSARKTLDLGSRKFDIRTPEMQPGADCFCQAEQRPNKTYRQFYRQLTFPAVTAGVGGSTPSLATIIPKYLTESADFLQSALTPHSEDASKAGAAGK